MKTRSPKKNNQNKLFITVIIILAILNISLICSCIILSKDKTVTQEILYKETKSDYNPEEKYYSKIEFKKFKTLLKSDKVTTVAVLDNSSNTKNKFLEAINKISYYKNTKINLLEISKLSKKDEIYFYGIDDRLKNFETNYLITINRGKVISITTFDNTKLNIITEGMSE